MRERRGATNLPAWTTSFVGRRNLLAEVRGALGDARVLTLTGSGGAGKTRLALQVAAGAARTFGDGVWLVELAHLASPDAIAPAIAGALGIRQQTEVSSAGALAHEIRDTENMMLVLDNCEHLIDGCAEVVTALLQVASGVTVLATSRQPLGVPGERVLRVPPLAVPDDGATTPDQLIGYEAVSLFVERAMTTRPGFMLTTDNASAIADICRELDGMPLAIELAVARLRSLPVGEVHRRLEDRFRLLTLGSRAVPNRQQTLRAAIDWSYELAAPAERTLWQRLSVFADDFSLVGIEQICADDDLTRADIVDALDGLCQKSIAVLENHPEQARYRMQNSLREYGAEKLASTGRTAEFASRHARWYKTLAEGVLNDWSRADQVRTYRMLRSDHPQIMRSLDHLLDAHAADDALALAAGLHLYWLVSGRYYEARSVLQRALQASEQAPELDSTERARAMWVLGWIAALQGDRAAALSLGAKAREHARTAPDAAYATYVMGLVDLGNSRYPEACIAYNDAMRDLRAVGDRIGESLVRADLAAALTLGGDPHQAETVCHEGLQRCADSGEVWARTYLLWVLAALTAGRGDPRSAETMVVEGLSVAREFDDLVMVGLCVEALAWFAVTGAGDPARSAVLFGAAESVRTIAGTNILPVWPWTPHHDRARAAAMHAIGEGRFQTLYQRGRCFNAHQATTYALGENPSTPTTPTTTTASVLTPREWQTAELVANGLSNREIAKRLTIAPRTAEGHVERILRKLNLRSRSEIAKWIIDEPHQTPNGPPQRSP